MEIVIKINEDAYNLLEQKYRNGKADALDCIILNGNILPKGHGRLIDANNITFSEFFDAGDYAQAMRGIYNAPTIIEAERSDSE